MFRVTVVLLVIHVCKIIVLVVVKVIVAVIQ